MYAIAKGQTKDKNNGVVKFNFKHILSQVVESRRIGNNLSIGT